ncbi:hypothetical protein FGO68_gene14676 [Halteria grandinella]|uniref:Uncharacterized protein n=1 Tax=Halteria grandinella TaxID=5974 RepID=A0A8J8SVF8_HALGN|nr:hypothetical protein FGO68_gene14676 [Halteria grandinella]
MISQENFETSFSSQHSAGEEQVKKEPTEKHARHSAASESSNLKDIQSIFSASGGLTEIELDQQQHQRLTLSVLHFNSISSLTWFTGEAIGHIMENNPKSLWMRLWYPSSFIIAIWIIKLRIKYAGCKFSEKYASIILQFLMMYSVIEGQYYMHPERFEITTGVLLFIGQQQFFDLSMVTSLTQKNIKRAILWAIYYARNHQLYCKICLYENKFYRENA